MRAIVLDNEAVQALRDVEHRFRVVDHHLDEAVANVAAGLASGLAAVSVADAHLGAAVRALTHEEVVVLTSDPDDIARVAGDRPVRIVRV